MKESQALNEDKKTFSTSSLIKTNLISSIMKGIKLKNLEVFFKDLLQHFIHFINHGI